jgi:hypothetical protein
MEKTSSIAVNDAKRPARRNMSRRDPRSRMPAALQRSAVFECLDIMDRRNLRGNRNFLSSRPVCIPVRL